MKKVLSIALALMLGFASYAQMNAAKRVNSYTSPIPGKISAAPMAKPQGAKDLPNWQPIGSTWTATDLDGNTINIADTMAAGKALVIDYSATWCSWCWVVHQAGLLEAIHNQLGSDVCVLWIEDDATTSTQSIYGGSGSQGDWTNGGTVPYPIIDNPNLGGLINNNIPGYPTIVFVSPEGYWCDLYDTDWGFGPNDNPSQAVSAVSNLFANSPAAGQAPLVDIDGPNATAKNEPTTFEASIVSVDQVTAISWTITGADITTSTDNPITVTWANGGTYTVTLSVTNTSGTATATKTVTVNDWSNWGDTMSYCGDNDMYSSVGAGGDITWGIMIPAAFMTGREYLESVLLYVYAAGEYEMTVYQGGSDAPQSLIYNHTYTLSDPEWVSLPIYDVLALDDTKSLWITFHNTGVSYPAAYVDFVGDYNGSLIYYNNIWTPIQELSASLNSTWMIKAVTGSTPTLAVGITGPTSAQTGNSIAFSAAGPSGATYNWTFQGANSTSATGANVTATWDNGGTYTVTLNASYQGSTATATHTISIKECGTETLPFNMGFESNESLECWTFIDADADGFGWDAQYWNGNANYTHNGTGVIGSASYINEYGALVPDNWMISPRIAIPSDGATLSWWVGAVDQNYYAEKYSVLVSTTGTTPSDFTNTIYSGTLKGVTWEKVTKALNGYAGQDIYIAFRHHGTEDIYWMLIDDISVTAGLNGIDETSNANVALYPNPTNSVLNIAAEGLQTVEVMDMTGRMVMTTDRNTIDMSQLANGVYVVRVSTLNGTSIQKVVKK